MPGSKNNPTQVLKRGAHSFDMSFRGAACCLALCSCAALATTVPPVLSHQPPQIRALLAHAWALESGTQGQARNLEYAAALYCEAARHGNPEGHYRSGLLFMNSDAPLRNPHLAKSFLTYAQELGHPLAEISLSKLDNPGSVGMQLPDCLNPAYTYTPTPRSFDLNTYIASQPPSKQQIAKLVANLAGEYGISSQLALAIAAVESNFDPNAISPKQAMGVMQLIPATAARFNVRNPFDPEENIRGGLAYLRWLDRFFAGNIEKVIAAYNAGEGAVKRYGAPPPFPETQRYLARILSMTEVAKSPPPPATAGQFGF